MALATGMLLGAISPSPVRAQPPQTDLQNSRVIIDQIEFMGVTVFTQAEVADALELGAGDRLERSKVVRTAENLQSLYRLRGYEEVRVQTEMSRQKGESGRLETVLRFTIQERLPTRVAKIEFVSDGIRPDQKRPANWDSLESELQARVGVVVGDIYDQEKLSVGKRALQDVLASEEFIGAQVDEVRIATVTRPDDAAAEAARWVSLTYHLDLGDKVTFGFRGNQVFSRGILNGFIQEQRLIGFGKDYIGAIRGRIEEEYRAAGYPFPKLETYTFEKPGKPERHVTFEIHEGNRVLIESVEFDGNNVFGSPQLRKIFFERAGRLTQLRFYVEKEIEKASELLIEWIKSQGYLSAKLVTVSRSFTPDQKAIRLVLYLFEGEQTTVQASRYDGLKVFTPEEVEQILGLKPGIPLNLFRFSEGLEVLKAAYRARGHLAVKIVNEGSDSVVKYSMENRLADIHLEIAEGPAYRTSRIEIEGLGTTKEHIVRRELQFRVGEVLEEYKLMESEARLRKLGIFSTVSVRTADDPELFGHKIVRVTVQEGIPGIVAGGMGYRNDLGLRWFGQLGYTNMLKRNHSVYLNANANRRFSFARQVKVGEEIETRIPKPRWEFQTQVDYVWPWFLIPELTFRPRLSWEQNRYITFDAKTLSLAANFERQLLDRPNLLGLLTYSLESVKQEEAVAEVDNRSLVIGAIIPTLQLDMRDNSLAPTSGFFASSSFEWSDPALLSQRDPAVGYTRFQLRMDYYWTPLRNITWYFSARGGHERSTQVPKDEDDQSTAIPLIKQFALGGAGSLRGYNEQEINIQDIAVRGYATYVNYRTQIDLPLAGALRFGPFLDAANLLVDDFSFGRLRYGTGVGFHYQSPVGPINFDLGFKVRPRPQEEPWRFYFSVGVI